MTSVMIVKCCHAHLSEAQNAELHSYPCATEATLSQLVNYDHNAKDLHIHRQCVISLPTCPHSAGDPNGTVTEMPSSGLMHYQILCCSCLSTGKVAKAWVKIHDQTLRLAKIQSRRKNDSVL